MFSTHTHTHIHTHIFNRGTVLLYLVQTCVYMCVQYTYILTDTHICLMGHCASPPCLDLCVYVLGIHTHTHIRLIGALCFSTLSRSVCVFSTHTHTYIFNRGTVLLYLVQICVCVCSVYIHIHTRTHTFFSRSLRPCAAHLRT